jgi:hypothetical protein
LPLVGLSLDPLAGQRHLAGHALLDALRLAIPDSAIDEAIDRTDGREQRCRSLPARLVVSLVIALSVWSRDAARQVLANLVDGSRERQSRSALYRLPAKSSITEARQRLGPQPLIALFRKLAKPIATPQTPGAFLRGLRLMAFDSSTLDLPDTADNVRVFGRPPSGRSPTAYPQLRLIWLIEAGTHVLYDAVLRPYFRGEDAAAFQLLRSVGPGMLVLWDQGLHSYNLIKGILVQGAHFLGRAQTNLTLAPEQSLPDGSYLAYVYPSPKARRHRQDGVLVRVVEYTIDNPTRTGHGERHRLLTSLLDCQSFPATLLANEYHQRWEVELATDEVKVHQNDRDVHIRSQRPREVVQEVYGLLLAHLAIRTTMFHAAARVDLDPERLSFVNCLRILRRAIPRFQRAQSEQTPLCSMTS